MQLSAISSVNNTPRFTGSSNYQASDLTFEERLDALDAVKDKASQDVSPLTVALTSALSIAAILKGKDKIVPLIRRTAVQAGEMISTGMVKVFGGLVNKFKKNQPLDLTKAADSIKGFADKLRGEGDDSKMLETVKKVATNVLGNDEKANKLVDFLNNNKITNWIKALDAVVATALVVPLADKFSDKVENICDDTKIQQAAQALDLILDN